MQHQKTITITGRIKRWMSKKLHKNNEPQKTQPIRLAKLERPAPKKRRYYRINKLELLLIIIVILLIIIIPILIYASGGCLESTNYYNHGLI